MSPEERFALQCEKAIQELEDIDAILDRIIVKLNGTDTK